jgi:hypothetical protein
VCDSTCFGRLPAHHKEHTTALGASGFTVEGKRLERCWSWSGRPRPTTIQPQRSNGKTRGSYCSCTLLMMGGEVPETYWATHKRQVINLWNCCILLVDLFETNTRLKPKSLVRACVCVCVSHHVNVRSSISNLIKFGMRLVIKSTLTSKISIFHNLIMTWRNVQICRLERQQR